MLVLICKQKLRKEREGYKMDKPYISVEDCTDLAFQSLQKAKVQLNDVDVETLAESIKLAIDAWFGDMKHLAPSYRPKF